MGIPGNQRSTPHAVVDNEWLVFFVDVPLKQWWNKHGITRAGFEHCLAVQYTPRHDRWTLVDWTLNGLDVLVLDPLELHYLFTWAAENNGTVVNYQAPRIDYRRKIIRMFPMYCVNIVLQALKIDQHRIFTPYQLFRYLMKTGGTIVRGQANG